MCLALEVGYIYPLASVTHNERNLPVKLIIASVVLALAALTVPATSAEAAQPSAVRLESPTRAVKHVRVTYVQKTRNARLWIEFNTGSLWSVTPCRYEDSNNCYWNARKHGNGKGRSFVTLRGKTYYSERITR